MLIICSLDNLKLLIIILNSLSGNFNIHVVFETGSEDYFVSLEFVFSYLCNIPIIYLETNQILSAVTEVKRSLV
jgi:hypothetical protein